MPAALRLFLLATAGLAAAALLLIALGLGGLYARIAWNARSGTPLVEQVVRAPTPPTSSPAQRDGNQILFGDLHVHTSYSADAQLMGIGLAAREPDRGPSDACDFARFCSQLDFWSINDHAESLTPHRWKATIDAVRDCNAAAGDPSDPDLVSFLGWEWSHRGLDAETHWGHKNVVLRETGDDEIPVRPLASEPGPPYAFLAMGAIGPFQETFDFSHFADFHRYTRDVTDVPDCEPNVGVRDLPADCRELADRPEVLFAKLDEWGHPALVIPHGLAWGTTNPAHARLDVQLAQHDPARQRLLEVYSGHGNSEVFRDFRRPTQDSEGRWTCPAPDPSSGVELCCQRAPAVAHAYCAERGSQACDAAIDAAVQVAAAADAQLGSPHSAVEGSTIEDWGECGQLGPDAFLPSFDYRPRQSAQYALAIGERDGKGEPRRFRWGFIGSSDTHRARPGTGYKEFGRKIMTDGAAYPIPRDFLDERAGSLYYTGGLAAVHAPRRDRGSIFEGLERRETYATSGDRILLWFDWVGEDGQDARPMGSEIASAGTPRFRVRAMGAFEQRPGCPAFVHAALSTERIESLCLGECHHPSETRKAIQRIEVVRIRPEDGDPGSVASRIEDPWRVIECADDRAGCVVEFEDAEYARAPRETAYYVRAIQAPSSAVNGDPLRCERDESGTCVRSRPCGERADGMSEDCLAPVAERAWSSPIFLRPADAAS